MVDINVNVSEKPGKTFEEAQFNLMRLTQTVPSSAETLSFAIARDVTQAIEKSVVRNGLVDGERTPQLKDSFDFRPKGGSIGYRITSDHPGALPLEEGASPHLIPDNPTGVSFIPENPFKYGVGPGERLYFSQVMHPGNDEYGYVDEAMGFVMPEVEKEVNSKSKNMVSFAGFKRVPRK